MLWHAIVEPQRQTPSLCGFAGMPSFVGRPSDVTAGEKPNLGDGRT